MEHKHFQIYWDGVVLCTHFSKHTELDEKIVNEWLNALSYYFFNKSTLILMDWRHIRSMTKKARQLIARSQIVRKFIAVAVITQYQMQKLYYDAIKMINRPPYFFEHFQDKSKALHWLSGQLI